jgi:(R,R)-butanediol dehydrogenase/meso-butanediol dehydrogenase/diacetyl reductase
MRAWQYHGAHDLRLMEVPEPVPAHDQVLVRPAFNGLCGTDVHQFFGGTLAPVPLPIGVGHEASAVVVEVGSAVGGIAVGDSVAIEPVRTCGQCRPCGRGLSHLCQTPTWFGLTEAGGGLAELAVVEPSMLHRLPPSIDLQTGALIEPLSVSHHAVEMAEVRPDETAVVFGAGPIGIGAFLALRAHGVERIVVVEPSPSRRATIGALGAEHVIDPDAGDLAAFCADLTHGDGIDAVIEAAGVEAAFRSAIDVLGARGRLVVVAAHTAPVQLDLLAVLMREVQIKISFAYNGDFARVIDHVAAGKYSTESWVERVPFTDVVDALERLHAGVADKVLVEAAT